MYLRITLWMTLVLISFTNSSIHDNGTQCPCLSYYSLPDYDCLLEKLEKRQILPSLCLHLMQAMDSGHRFRVIKTNLDCNQHQVYMYPVPQSRSPGPRSSVPVLVSNSKCLSVYKNSYMFHILSPRKTFFQVVYRNLQLLNLNDEIDCQLEFRLFKKSNATRFDDPLVTEKFSCLDGKFSSIGISKLFLYTLLDLSPPGFVKNALNLTADETSPGSLIVNTQSLSFVYARHFIGFTCQWGAETPYYSSTTAHFEEWYDTGTSTETLPYSLAGTTIEEIGVELTCRLAFQRIFANSIVFQLFWRNSIDISVLLHRRPRTKSFETVCKFFDIQDTVYQPEICISCWKNGTSCSECWDAASLVGKLSPSIQLRSSDTGVLGFSAQIFAMQTKHRNILPTNASCGTSVNHGSHFRSIFQYDYIFGGCLAYMTQDKNISNTTDPDGFFSDSVILPGPQKNPTDLSSEQSTALSMICRVRAEFVHNTFSKWSSPVWTTFSKNKIHISTITLSLSKNRKTYLIQRKDDYSSVETHTWRVHGERLPHFLSGKLDDRKYEFSATLKKSGASDSEEFVLNYGLDENGMMEPSDVYSKRKPLSLRWAALHSFVLWTEKLSQEGRYRVMQVNVDRESGIPMAAEKFELQAQKLCDCSNEKYITSPAVAATYRNLSDPEEVEITVVCGSAVCLYNMKKEMSSGISIAPQTETRHILVDQNHVYLVCCPDESGNYYLKIFWITSCPQQKILCTVHAAEKSLTFGRRHKGIPDLEVQPPIYLPAPVKHCFDPHINRGKTSVTMLNQSTILIQVSVAWDNSAECDQFSHPSTAIEIDYANIPQDITIKEDPGFSCTSLLGSKCISLPKSVHHGSSVFTTKITDAASEQYYFIDIGIKAAVDKELYEMWYTGFDTPPDQTFRRVIFTQIPENRLPLIIAMSVGTLVVLLLVLSVSGTVYWLYTRKMYMYKHLNRISAKDIQKEVKLGEGNFGEVWKATLGKDTIVIKMLKESATDREEKEFRDEALILSKFSSNYIVKAVGICLQSRPIMLGLEFVNGGSLDKYLKQNDVRSTLHAEDLFRIAEHAVKGCVYLEQEGYLHRDIASRNCLIATVSDANVRPKCVKLTDFGLAKDTGTESDYSSRDPDTDTLPIAWTAPEAFSGKFSTKSDVWAFGVLIWEIFTWGASPYGPCSFDHVCPPSTPRLTHNDIEFKVCVEKKNLLSFPDPCTAVFCPALKHVMGTCWEFRADDRPSFQQLQKYLIAARTEVLKADVQMSFAQTGLEMVSSKTVPKDCLLSDNQDLGAGKKRFRPVQQAYGGQFKTDLVAYGPDQQNHPFSSDRVLPAEVKNSNEAIQLLTLPKEQPVLA